jgi:hypothetical protein
MKCANLLDIFVSPGDLFDEIIAAPLNLANWRVPTLLVCFVTIISVQLAIPSAQSAVTIHNLPEAGTLSTAQTQAFAGAWPLLSALFICATTFAGTCWAAFVLWFIGRFFLKVRFPYFKALEVVGLTGSILK